MIIRTDPMIFLRLQEKDIRWKSPYLLYEGDVTIGDTETMIKF